MNISTPIYEKLPLIYMVSAVALLFYSTDIIALFSCAILYGVGCTTAVMRSNHRRQTRAKMTVKGIKLPHFIYEYYPYIFIALAITLIRFYLQPATIALAIILILFAMKNLLLRRQYRFNKIKFNGVKSK